MRGDISIENMEYKYFFAMLFVFDRIEFENLFRYTVVTERKFEIGTDTKVTLR